MRDKFGLAKMVMAGDRGMITSARIAALNQLEDGTARPDPYGWIIDAQPTAARNETDLWQNPQANAQMIGSR